MNKQPTPGEWRVEADAENEGKHPFHSYRHVTSYDPAQSGKVTICDMRDSSHMAADANLIANAKTLLAMNAKLAETLDDALANFPITTQTDRIRYGQMRILLDENQRWLAGFDRGCSNG